MNTTDKFINNIVSFSNRQFDDNVLHHARKCYLDYLGCVLAGCAQNKKRIKALEQSGLLTQGNCTVLGSEQKLLFRDAGFVNGFNAHAMELDDGHRYAMLHIEAPVFSAMTAMYEQEHLSAEAFYKGAIVGYEVTVRLSRAMQPWHKVRGFHSTGTCATVGVAMAAAAALNYNFYQMKSALSAAASSAAGLLEMLADDSELKPYNVGRAVMDGLTAAYIGKAGYIPPVDILGGKRGFLNVLTDTQSLDFLEIFDANDNPCILGNFFKPYPACRHCHSTIDAALQIARENEISPESVEQIKIGTYKLALTGHDHTIVNSAKSAMMSIPYGAVVALVKKDAGLSQYKDGIVHSEIVQNLLKKVEIVEDTELTKLLPDIRAAKVTVKTAENEYQCRIDYSLGEPENPMDDNAIIKKFITLAEFVGIKKEITDQIIRDVYKGKIITKFD